ncbi:MAG: hypothetical protein JNN07_17350 [Verrucomicrobiales bacterium]|nr:hypothetical protein [Verrucomicrobiales bacterium]
MKTLCCLCLLAWSALGMSAQVNGSLSYQNTGGTGKEKYVFLNLMEVYPGGATQEQYLACCERLAGADYSAQLWYSPLSGSGGDSLKPVPGSLTTFRSGNTAGLIFGKAKLEIPDTFGGDTVTLQLRAWKNDGGVIIQWKDALVRGASEHFKHVLGGITRDGTPVLGTGNMAVNLRAFAIIPVPEPTYLSAVAAAVVFGWVRSRRRR